MIHKIVAGLLTGSMALLADGIHMGSHVLAIGLSWALGLLRDSGRELIARIY